MATSKLPAVDASALTNLFAGNITTGTLAIARGGTGLAAVAPVGNFLVSDGSTYINGTISAGSGISVGYAGGAYTITSLAAGGSVTKVVGAGGIVSDPVGGVIGAGTLTVDASAIAVGTLAIAQGGTGASTKTAAFDALSPVTTKGDIIVRDGANNIRSWCWR